MFFKSTSFKKAFAFAEKERESGKAVLVFYDPFMRNDWDVFSYENLEELFQEECLLKNAYDRMCLQGYSRLNYEDKYYILNTDNYCEIMFFDARSFDYLRSIDGGV